MTIPRIARTFLSGLAVVLPIVITVAVLVWLVTTTEEMLAVVMSWILPGDTVPRGLGLLTAIGLIFAIGVLMEAVLFRRLMEWFDGLLNHIPLVKTVYGAVRDLMSLFANSGKRKFSKVVLVKFPGLEASLIGFVTIEDFSGLPVSPGAGQVAVYLPMAYNIGGYTVFMPREYLTPLDMGLEEAMRFVVTAGMSR